MQSKIKTMMDFLKSVKFNAITVDGKILLTAKVIIDGEEKEFSQTLNWDGDEDYWATISIGKYLYDVNVWVLDKERIITAYPCIDGETITSDSTNIHSEPYLDVKEVEQKYYFARINEINGEQEYTFPNVYAIPIGTVIEECLKEVLVSWYGNGEDGEMQETGSCEHLGGEITVSVDNFKEISKEHYDVLSQYI